MTKKIDRTGEIGLNKFGSKMIIQNYKNSHDIDIYFPEYNCIIKHKEYGDFKRGYIKCPNENREFNKLGEEGSNKFGSKMIIIKSESYNNVDIYFPEYNWTAKNRTYQTFQDGNIKCPYERRLYGVGYLGEGKYKAKEGRKATLAYRKWNDMLRRCYSEAAMDKNPTYRNCYVCEEWHNFQVFAEWFYKHYYTIKDELMEIDKDILHKGNKIYSPDTCLIVPQRINKLFTKSDKSRGDYPIGLYPRKKDNVLVVKCSIIENGEKNKKYLGRFPLHQVEEAFLTYKRFKENYIKQVADEYKNSIPDKVYQALYNYEVEITD